MKVYFLTGASGVGKTTLLDQLVKKYDSRNGWVFLHFDSIGVPSVEKMTEDYGSPAGWQEAMTYKWIDRILTEYAGKGVVILEGQVNLDFIKKGFEKHDFKNYQCALVDCDEEEMAYRLTHKRNQPELLNEDMRNWLKFLRKQAQEQGVAIIDTSHLSPEEVLASFESKILQTTHLNRAGTPFVSQEAV